MSKTYADITAELVAENEKNGRGKAPFHQNVLLIIHGLYDTPWKALITLRDAAIVQKLYECDGVALYDLDDRPEACPLDTAKWLRDSVLKYDDILKAGVADRLREYFGPPNVFIIPAKGYVAGKLVAQAGISAIVSVDWD